MQILSYLVKPVNKNVILATYNLDLGRNELCKKVVVNKCSDISVKLITNPIL